MELASFTEIVRGWAYEIPKGLSAERSGISRSLREAILRRLLEIAWNAFSRDVDARQYSTLCPRVIWVQVMPYPNLMPSMPALQQAMQEPLERAPRDYNKFAVYIFERAREIDHEWALAKTLTAQCRRGTERCAEC